MVLVPLGGAALMYVTKGTHDMGPGEGAGKPVDRPRRRNSVQPDLVAHEDVGRVVVREHRRRLDDDVTVRVEAELQMPKSLPAAIWLDTVPLVWCRKTNTFTPTLFGF